MIDQVFAIVYVLLLLSVIISLFGIVNTLGLSIYERIRELGLLRAVGMSRRQVKRMIRVEAVIIAVLGALLGLAIGILFGWAMQRALKDVGISRLTIPVRDSTSIEVAQRYAAVSDYLLLDTMHPRTGVIGATGLTHDWSLSARIVGAVGRARQQHLV